MSDNSNQNGLKMILLEAYFSVHFVLGFGFDTAMTKQLNLHSGFNIRQPSDIYRKSIDSVFYYFTEGALLTILIQAMASKVAWHLKSTFQKVTDKLQR
ncbi:hypothetical protein F9C07_2148248 [Aspergillus flavus]|uniref:Uncharacterized protein n=1 Tax=Aspergillus flavus (strain ATCC 200026 / FGSC A1120 / IAM 13836 / NRRL 3357 / JCM 12722 / SRRC 167) TaxID=332952 RepID=A0A7U2MKD6_ASPFN|nr:hypothetical protein F9C07_2148248 [Aspergillus flavus]